MHELAETVADALKVLGCKVERDVVLEGRSGRVVTPPLLVEAQGRTYAVWFDQDAQEDVLAAEALRADLGADGIVLALRAPDGDDPEGVACWPRHVLSSLLGDALLAECGLAARPIPWPAALAPSRLDETLPPSFSDGQDVRASVARDLAPLAAVADSGTWAGEHEEFPPWEVSVTSSDRWEATEGPVDPFATAPETRPPSLGLPWDKDPGPFALDALAEAPPLRDKPAADTLAARAADFDRLRSETDVATLGPPLSAGALHPELWDLSIEEEPTRPRRLPVRLTPRDADALARRQAFTVDRYLLVLHPVHLFDVEVDTLRQGRLDARTERMRLQLHGTDRAVSVVDAGRVDASLPDLLAPTRDIRIEERTLRVQPERARELVQAWILAAHTRVVEVPVGGDLFEYTERRKVTPRDDQVRVTPLGVFHRPVWRLEGPSGVLELDAMTGEVVASQAHSYPDTMLIE